MENEKNKVAFVSMLAAIFLTSFKLIVGVLTGSLGILSEAMHSGLDLVAAAITWVSVRLSDKPADKDHHFGHGKIENLSAFLETILLLITSVWIINEAVNRLISGSLEIEVTIWSYVVVISSIIIDFTRSRALMKAAKLHNSQALKADAIHFSTDIWSSAVVLMGLICAEFGIFVADSIAALLVAFIVMFVSYRLGKDAINVLLDRVPEEMEKIIISYLDTFSDIKHYHNLKVRSGGADTFIEVTIHLDSALSLVEAHDITTAIEENLMKIIKRGEVIVHAEPDEDH